jgi:hypothetical protein
MLIMILIGYFLIEQMVRKLHSERLYSKQTNSKIVKNKLISLMAQNLKYYQLRIGSLK